MVMSENALIFTYLLWLIGRRDFGLDLKVLRRVIARWFFMCHTTGRYTSSPESQIEADLSRVSSLRTGDGAAFCEELDRIVRSNFTGDYWAISLPNRLDTSAARSPALFSYWAALNLLDAELLFSDLRIREQFDPISAAPRGIEQHHLFPRSHLASAGIASPRQVNAIANTVFLDWPENVEIDRDSPQAYWPVMVVGMDKTRLERQVYWHALPVGWAHLDYPTFLERRRTLIAAVVRDGFNTLWDDRKPFQAASLKDMIAVGESQTLEFKATARWNLRIGQADKKMEHAVSKAVCGFLNAEGGKLLIGVNDSGTPIGLAHDMKTLGNKSNRDGFELFLRQHLDNSLSAKTATVVRINVEELEGKDVCVVSIAASGKPVFAKASGGSPEPYEFWVRMGNATKQLHGDDMLQYQTSHWG